MTRYLIFTILLIGFQLHSQEAVEPIKHKVQHSIYASGGLFFQTGTRIDNGWSAEFGYQVRFPSRFVVGLGINTDQSKVHSLGENEFYSERTERAQALTFNLALGIHLARKKHFDFILFIVPHYKYWRKESVYHSKETNEISTNYSESNYIFLPILYYSLDFFYKINPAHAFGLGINLHASKSFDSFGDIFNIDSDYSFKGRLMLAYRFTF